MRRATRMLALALVLMLASTLMFALCRISSAAEITYTVSPEAISGPGYVNIYLNIKNTSTVAMTDISVATEDTQLPLPNSSIAAGKTQQLLISNFHVTEHMLSTGVVFLITWMENDAFMSKPVYVTFPIASTPAPTTDLFPTTQPEVTTGGFEDRELLSFEYSVSSRSAEEGDEVTVAYTIRNISAATVTGITLLDTELAGNSPIFSNISLPAGQTYKKSYTYVMGETSATASPTLTYTGALGNIRSIRGNSTVIERVTVQMDVSVSMGENTAEGTTFTLKLTNNGNKAVSDITIKDENGNTVKSGLTLNASETQLVDCTVPPDETRDVKFTVTGRLATGDTYSYESSTYRVWKYIDQTQISLIFDIQVVEPLNDEGYITLEFTVTNEGTIEMSDLVITESNVTTDIGSIAKLAGGEHTTEQFTVYTGGARDLKFTLCAKAPNEQPFEYNTIIKANTISKVQEATPYEHKNPISVGSTVSSLLKSILTVLAILTAVSGVILIVLAVFEYESNRRIRTRRHAEKRPPRQSNEGEE